MNKNLIPEVLKLLGVEYDERFKLTNTDGVITENDVFCFLSMGCPMLCKMENMKMQAIFFMIFWLAIMK